jgi:hypothetical protein
MHQTDASTRSFRVDRTSKGNTPLRQTQVAFDPNFAPKSRAEQSMADVHGPELSDCSTSHHLNASALAITTSKLPIRLNTIDLINIHEDDAHAHTPLFLEVPHKRRYHFRTQSRPRHHPFQAPRI